MSVSANFYLTQVESCAKSARDAKLDNERDRYLRSQDAWQALADKEIRVRAARAERDAEKLVQDEPAPLAL